MPTAHTMHPNERETSLYGEEPNEASLEAIRETEEILSKEKAGRYKTADEMLRALEALSD